MKNSKNITIFCGSKIGKSQTLKKEVEQLAKILSEENFNLVYGGSKYGIMGLFADQFLKKERKVIGIRYENQNTETAHPDISELIIAENLHIRKEKLIQMSDVILVLPGGLGTLDEFFEVFSQHKSFDNKQTIVFNPEHFYDHLEELITQIYESGYIRLKDKNAVYFSSNSNEILERIIKY